MRKYLILSLSAVLLAASCTRTYRAIGDTHLTVFDHAHVQFLPDSLGGFTDADADGIVHLTNGRIILKKIQGTPYGTSRPEKLFSVIAVLYRYAPVAAVTVMILDHIGFVSDKEYEFLKSPCRKKIELIIKERLAANIHK